MSDGDIPFRAEYAKSGRSRCVGRLCCNPIRKGTLRMAEMVQSPEFDGKYPTWYHFNCFFKESSMVIKNTSEVAGFASLRWIDQDRIKKKMTVASSTTDFPSSSMDVDEEWDRKRIRSDLMIEYAKSSKELCKICNVKINKGDISIAKMGKPNATEKKYSCFSLEWLHVECFLEHSDKLGAEKIKSPRELSGFTKLKEDDKYTLKIKFNTKIAERKNPVKREREGDSHPAKKKQKTLSKEEALEEKALKDQSRRMWDIRDGLQMNLNKKELQLMLKDNRQKVPKGESEMLDRIADGMTFGALKRCPTCGGQLAISTQSYVCEGDLSEWSKCMYSTSDPERVEWIIPRSLTLLPVLHFFKFKACKRIFPESKATTVSRDITDGPGPSQSVSTLSDKSSQSSSVDLPLESFTVYVTGHFSKNKSELKERIISLGGRVVKFVSMETTICLSTKDTLEEMTMKMKAVKECNVPVVGEDFLDAAASGDAQLKIPEFTISYWGASPTASDNSEEDERFKPSGPSKIKVTVKGGAVVDPEFHASSSFHVLEEGKTIWNAVLTRVDISVGTNSFYKLQLLESDPVLGSPIYVVFRSWGRVGTTIGGVKTEECADRLARAKAAFCKVYFDKTGIPWRTKGKKVPGKFYPVEIDYGQNEATSGSTAAGSTSKLPQEIQQLVRMLFDVESMKKAMLEFEIDTEKLPLGKLSRQQIRDAYKSLSELLKEIQGDKNPGRIMDASNRFYTLIPHDFGMKKPPLLDNEEVIKRKAMMLDNLLEIELAYSLLKQQSDSVTEGKHPIDVQYGQLKTDLEVLPKDSEEFKRLVEYVKNTHGSTHTMYQLEVEEVFKVSRHGEEEIFKPYSSLHNRQLLWHGSRTTNFCGILSQGLRIAPPEAPCSGYMFGKGVYFADMVSKSANYCYADPIGLLLLCEVALGNMYELTTSEYVEQLPEGRHSTKGLGTTAPDPSGNYTSEDGVLIPMGYGKRTSVDHTSLFYNEYIVYDVRQIRMHYLLKMKFNY